MSEDDAKTLWCGNLSEQVNEELLYELFLQAGPLEKVRIPRDPRDGRQRNFAFITYSHEVSVPYAIALFQGTSLFNRTLSLQCRGQTLPPAPIRWNAEQPIDFTADHNIQNQFMEMTEQRHQFPVLNGDQHAHSNTYRGQNNKWGQRQHPYKSEERGAGRRHRGDRNDRSDRVDRDDHCESREWEGRRGRRDLYPQRGGRRKR